MSGDYLSFYAPTCVGTGYFESLFQRCDGPVEICIAGREDATEQTVQDDVSFLVG